MTKQAAAAAGFWSGLDIIIRQAVLFGVSLVLARLLTPEDFGIIALLSFFTGLSLVVVQGGLSAALIQRQATSRDEESAVFWWNLMASSLLAAMLVASGPAIADFYGYAVLRSLSWVAAAQVLFSALGAVQNALLARELRFAQLTAAGLFSTVLAGIAGVVAAFLDAGVWALAIQITTLAMLNSAALWVVSDWRPTFHFRLRTITSLFRFGGWVSVGSVLEVLYSQGFALLVGKLHGVRELGLYNRASGTQLLPSTILSAVIGRVALPLFSSRGGDNEALRRGLRLALRFAMLLNVPIMIGLALLSDLVIEVLFGNQWLRAAPILSVLAVGGILLPVHVLNLQLVLAQGEPTIFIRNELAKKAIGVVCVVVGSFFGVMGLAYSQIVYNVLAFLVNAQPARRTLRYGALQQLSDIKGIVCAAGVMSAAVLLIRFMLEAPAAVLLMVCTAAGAAVYFGAGWASRSAAFAEAADILLRTPLAERLLRSSRTSG